MHAIKKINAKEHESTDEEIEEMINESMEPIDFFGMKYEPGRVLREIDPTAFREIKLEHGNNMYECGKCGTVYESEDEAESCCNEEE